MKNKNYYAIGVGVLLLASSAADAVTYTPLILTAPNGGAANAYGLNDSGQVVGWWSSAGSARAFITGANGVGMTDLGTLGGGYAEAFGVNNSGQVVGYSATADGGVHAFITGAGGAGMTLVGDPSNLSNSYATAVNATGQVVGYANAFITGANGVGLTYLGTLGGNVSAAFDINASGQVVGQSRTSNGSLRAFITGANGDGMIDLGTLGGGATVTLSGGGFSSGAAGINDSGQVTGYSTTLNGTDHAFITGANGVGMFDLGALGGANDSSGARGINAAGQVVGYDSNGHAFVTSADGANMTDLNSLLTTGLASGGYLEYGMAINTSGQIIASDEFGNYYLLTPTVPLPASAWLMLSSLCSLGVFARKRH